MHNTSIPLSTPVHNTLFSEPLRTQTKSSFYTLSGFKCLICRYYENANDQWMEQKIFALSNWLHKVKSSLPTMTCLTKNICSFFLSLRLPLFFKPVIVAVWRQPVNFLCHIFILIEDKLCSYRVLFFFSLLLYFSLFYYGWADTIGAALVSLHFWLFNMLKSLAWVYTKIFKFKFSNFLN